MLRALAGLMYYHSVLPLLPFLLLPSTPSSPLPSCNSPPPPPPLSSSQLLPKREAQRAPPAPVSSLLTFTSSFLCVISRRAIGHTVVPQQQVLGVLTPQADAPGVVEISCTLLAQRMAVWRGQGSTEKADDGSTKTHYYTKGQMELQLPPLPHGQLERPKAAYLAVKLK